MQKNVLQSKPLLIMFALAILAVGFWLFHSPTKQQSLTTAPTVKTILAKTADQNIPLEIAGFVRGENRADISPMTSGRILHIFKHEGELVKKGEIIATIDAQQSNVQVASASASVDALQKTLDDSKKYYDQLVDQTKTGADSNATDEAVKSAKRGRDLQVQATRDQLIAAQGALNIAQVGKNNATITAPFTGTITAIYGREGGFANFPMPLLSISTQNSFEIETYVSATDGRNLSIGSIVALQSATGQPLTGTITAVSAGSDSQSLKTLVRIHINNETGDIRLGDFLHGQIMLPRTQAAISIPRNAIISRAGDQFVFVLDENNITHEQIIKTANESDDFIDVTEGLDANQKIVTEGQQYLLTGLATIPYATN